MVWQTMEQAFIFMEFVRTIPMIKTECHHLHSVQLHLESQSLTPGEQRNMVKSFSQKSSLLTLWPGSTWYHSHFALQAWEGVLGGIIINGPATANYDNDAGVLFLNDWTHETCDALYSTAESSGPPTLDNGLINGTNVYDDGGSRFEMDFVAGESYRIRLVNGAIDSMFKFMIDNHTMTVIAADLVPIVPYDTTVLSIGMGQRYDIVVNASESSGDFWMRAIPQTSCSENDSADNIKGIIRYDSSSTDDPTTSAYTYTDSCDDEDMANLVPYLAVVADEGSLAEDSAVTVGKNSASVFKWYMAATTFAVRDCHRFLPTMLTTTRLNGTIQLYHRLSLTQMLPSTHRNMSYRSTPPTNGCTSSSRPRTQ